MREMKTNPLRGARKLIDPRIGEYRVRVGEYRIIFDIRNNFSYGHNVDAFLAKNIDSFPWDVCA